MMTIFAETHKTRSGFVKLDNETGLSSPRIRGIRYRSNERAALMQAGGWAFALWRVGILQRIQELPPWGSQALR